MDKKTIEIYDKNARAISERHKAMTPSRLYELAQTFFLKGEATLDLGCGIGRDTQWLSQNGFPASGVDAAEGMLKVAREDYPQLKFEVQTLPDITLSEESYSNIFCCAVLMHIPRSDLVSSVVNILKIMKPKGRLVISFKDSTEMKDGRTFNAYHLGQVAQLFESLGGKVLFQEFTDPWKTLVVEKSDLSKREGINQIQDIIIRDKKTATYKFALLRALCEISRYEPHSVTWYRDGDMVLVPLKRIAIRWVHYYFPLVKRGMRQTTSKQMAFEQNLMDLPLKATDMSFLKVQLEDKSSKEIQKLLKKVSDTIHKGPVTFAGGGDNPVFQFVSSLDASVYPDLKESEFGSVAVPLSLWRDISLFSHWIEDSIAIQWAELSEKINKDGKFAVHFDLITKSVQEDERSTYLIRKLFNKQKVECVWTGKLVDEFAVDHMIPWTIWKNNDLWNLLPAHPAVNNQKRDFLPTPGLVRKRFDVIRRYWETYEKEYSALFGSQLERGLGLKIEDAFKAQGAEALEQNIIRISHLHCGAFWQNK